jgi:hypothetical protein
MSLPRKLKNFMLFNEGLAYLGEVPSVTLPKLKRKMESYRAGGMKGPVKLDYGMEEMSMQWTAAGYLKDALSQFGMLTVDGVGMRFSGAIQADDSELTSALEVVVRGRHEEIDFGTSEAGKPTEVKFETTISYYKLAMDGDDLIEIDFVNMIEIVNGVNLNAALLTALGMA